MTPTNCSSTSPITGPSNDELPGHSSHPNSRLLRHVAEEASEALASTSASFLVGESPLTVNDHPPQFIPIQFTPTRKRRHDLLDRQPGNEIERSYQDALRESYLSGDRRKTETVSLQAAGVLNGMYCTRLRGQLEAQIEKEQSGKKRKGKLMGDGLPKYLTGDEFYQRVVDHEKAAEDEELAKEERRKTKGERSEARVAWKNAEKGRVGRNKTRRQEHKKALVAWEAERALAKQEHRRAQWKHPVLTGIEPAPKVGKKTKDAGNGDESGEGIDGNASDGTVGEDDSGSALED